MILMAKKITIYVLLLILVIIKQNIVEAANFTEASTNISNGRFSYIAGVKNAIKGSKKIVIDRLGNPDNNTKNLFPRDELCFSADLKNCKSDKLYKVAKILNDTAFSLTEPLSEAIGEMDYVVVMQKSNFTINFTTSTKIPTNERLLITIPAVDKDGATADGFPDTSTAIISNGFDLNQTKISDILVTGCGNRWTTSNIEPGTSLKNHEITILNQGECAENSALTVRINPSDGIINPGPVKKTLEGKSDVYGLRIRSYTSQGELLDEIITKIAQLQGTNLVAEVGRSVFGQGILFGYTSPQSTVKLEGVSVGRETKSDQIGYFQFEDVYSLARLKEVCLSSQDSFGRTSTPTCITPPYSTGDNIDYGPVILSPTVSLNKKIYYSGDEVVLEGQTIPNREVSFSFFTDDKAPLVNLVGKVEAAAISEVEALADAGGRFSVSFPSTRAQTLRLFSQTIFDNQFSPKSNTLQLEILPFWMRLLLYLALLLALLILGSYFYVKRFFSLKSIVLAKNYPLVKFKEESDSLVIYQESKRSI